MIKPRVLTLPLPVYIERCYWWALLTGVMLFSSLLVSFLLNYPFLVSLLLNLLHLKLRSGHCSQCNINPSFGFSLSLSLIASQSSICSQKWFTLWSPGTLKLLSLLPAPLPQPSSFSDTLRQLYYCPNWTILFWRVKGDTNQTWFWDKGINEDCPWRAGSTLKTPLWMSGVLSEFKFLKDTHA